MAIDRQKVIDQMANVKPTANEDGLIPAFNVLVNALPAKFWNEYTRRMVDTVNDDIKDAVEELLSNAAHECAYHTGHGIISSKEWEAIVGPMVENKEDILHGAFGVCTGWGWADAEIVELIPGEKLVVRAHDYYEADIAEEYPGKKAPRMTAYLIKGACSAFMDLVYGGEYDPEGKSGLYTFHSSQTKGIECGDEYGEFVAVKSENYESL